MIIDAPSALAITLRGTGHTADVTPVVVAKQNHHVIRNTQAGIVVVLHLLVQGPHLRGLFCRAPRHLLDNLTLLFDDALQQFHICRTTHRLITIAAHSDGHDILAPLYALYALAEEHIQTGAVRAVVPRAPLRTTAGVLLMIAGHGFVVRSANHHSHAVCQLAVLRIVGIKCPSPHGGPQHIPTQTKNKLKDTLVELMTAEVRSIHVLHPRCQTGCLVVQEDAAESHSWLAVAVFAADHIRIRTGNDRSIGPPVPGRHTQLAAQLVDAIDGATTVAAGNDQLLAYRGDYKHLALAPQLIQGELVQLLITAKSADEDSRSICRLHRHEAQHTAHVLTQTLNSHLHAIVFLFAVANRGISQRQGTGLWAKADERFCCKKPITCDKEGEEYGKDSKGFVVHLIDIVRFNTSST